MATAVTWLVGTVLMFLGFGVLACTAMNSRRRSPFYVRLLCSSAVTIALALGVAASIGLNLLPQRVSGVLWVLLLLASLAVAPLFCYRGFAWSDDRSDEDGGSGPGRGPPPPPKPPGPPSGGIPLPNADQARSRRRDHNRSSLREAGRRRPVPDPSRRRVPTR
jgi:hypothetical protein